ncbi:MAG TPA: response regulator transcription factor [Polyangiaceae bacterium]|nr:response regulator transcription factor [Polyangiaceae bacterium]
MSDSVSTEAVPPGRRRILIIDDHPLLRKGLSALINQEPDLYVAAEAPDGERGLEILAGNQFDMATVDISLPGSDGIELVKTIKQRHGDLPVLVVSMHDEVLFAERALRAGARGFIMKQEAADCILRAIRRVLEGQIYVSERIATRMLKKLVGGDNEASACSLDCLSDRELTIFRLIGKGYGTRQIAEELHLSIKTVESHRAHIKEKLEISSGTELVRCACVWSAATS